VPLESLPDWAQHISAFFPGRYAVEALKACVMGDGLGGARFSLLALLLIGAAGCVAGGRLFRWDSQQRFAAITGKAWVAVALMAWVAVGLAAETRHRTVIKPAIATSTPAPPTTVAAQPPSNEEAPPAPAPAPEAARPREVPSGAPSTAPGAAPSSPSPPVRESAPRPTPPAGVDNVPASPKPAPSAATAPSPTPAAGPAAPVSAKPEPPKPVAPAPSPGDWQKTSLEDIDREIDFTRLPPDAGVVTPIAPEDEEPDPEVAQQLDTLRSRLPDWPPAKVQDPVQRARNLLYVAAVPDVLQTPIERYAPLAVYEQLQQSIPKPQLIQALFWIALHPMDGDDSAADQLAALGMNYSSNDIDETRNRAAFYAVKLLGRLTGKIASK
jgi:hypothetical protein